MQVGWWKVLWWQRLGSHSYWHDNWWFKYGIEDDAGDTREASGKRKRKKKEVLAREPLEDAKQDLASPAPRKVFSPPLAFSPVSPVSSQALDALRWAIRQQELTIKSLEALAAAAKNEILQAEYEREMLDYLARLAILRVLAQQIEDEELLLLLV